MAGDWTPIREDLYQHKNVLIIAQETELHPHMVVGMLAWLWLWAGKRTTTGFLPGVTLAVIDSVVGFSGFAAILQENEWLIDVPGGMRLSRWRKYNAKCRRQRDFERKKKQRQRARVPGGQTRDIDGTSTVRQMRDDREREKKEKSAAAPLFVPAAIDRPEFRAKWEEWLAYRRERGLPSLKPRSVAAQLRKISGWGIASAMSAIDRSIENAWQGLFEPKENGHGQRNGVIGAGKPDRITAAAERRASERAAEFPEPALKLPIAPPLRTTTAVAGNPLVPLGQGMGPQGQGGGKAAYGA